MCRPNGLGWLILCAFALQGEVGLHRSAPSMFLWSLNLPVWHVPNGTLFLPCLCAINVNKALSRQELTQSCDGKVRPVPVLILHVSGQKVTMQQFLITLLPTSLSRWLLAGSVPSASVFFSIPSYLPSELWTVDSPNLVLVRILLAVIAVLLCLIGSFASVVIQHKKVAFELRVIKKHIAAERMISFTERLNEIRRKSRS